MSGPVKKIPCTVAILTRNSGGTIERALQSARDFAELIVCDGGSTDRTLDFARARGCKIIPQDPSFKDVEGKIVDFAAVRNQTLAAASYDWFFYLDSDEVLTEELVAEIREAIEHNWVAAYWVDRKYELDDEVVKCAATYPTRQIRFFHTSCVNGFIKPIHERIEPKADALIKKTDSFMLVPVSSDPTVWRKKWQHYIELEVTRRGDISFADWLAVCAENLKISALYLFRYGRNLVFCRGNHMPWCLEWERHVYHLNLCRALWKHKG